MKYIGWSHAYWKEFPCLINWSWYYDVGKLMYPDDAGVWHALDYKERGNGWTELQTFPTERQAKDFLDILIKLEEA